MHPLHRLRGTAGFSLLELVTVLVLAGVAASLAVPAMGAYTGRHKARRALDRLAADVAYTRMAAVRSGEPARVRFEGASDYHIELRGSDPPRVRSVELDREMAGVIVLPPSGSLEFNSRGLLVSDPGSGFLVVEFGGTRDSLMITPAGRVYRDF